MTRISLNQLAALQASEGGELRWLIELPLLSAGGITLLQIAISREQGHSGRRLEPDDSPGWRVELALEESAVGALQVDVFVRGEAVSATFTRRTVQCGSNSTGRCRRYSGDLKGRVYG